jgi:transcriptional regulator with XRE-family HTH domain
MDVLVARDTRQYCVTVTLDTWQGRVTRTIAREIRRYRDERKMSAQQLADRTAELGMEIPRSVIANLESGRRETVTVPELQVLAAALHVAPVELACPAGFDEQTEILPDRMVDPLSASHWFRGELMLGVEGTETTLRLPGEGNQSNTSLVEEYATLLDDIRETEAQVAQAALDLDAVMAGVRMTEAAAADAATVGHDQEAAARLRAEADKVRQTQAVAQDKLHKEMEMARRYRDAVGPAMRYIRAQMRQRGMVLPPLPPSLRLDEDSGPVEGSKSS